MLILKYLPQPADQLEMFTAVESFDVIILQYQERADSHTDTSILHNLEGESVGGRQWLHVNKEMIKMITGCGSYSMLIRLFTRQHPPPPLEINSYHNRHGLMPPNEPQCT